MVSQNDTDNILIWNCRGLRNLRTEDQLIELVRVKDPFVVFIAETWTDKAKLEMVQNRIQFKNLFEVPRRNKASGLAIETFSKYHIDTTINKNKENEWRFTSFYGEPDTQQRHESWAKLRSLKQCSHSPWLCAGEFQRDNMPIPKKWRQTKATQPNATFSGHFGRVWLHGLGFCGFPFHMA